ncbi:integration host factor (plasmid) [Streptomyces globisporus]|uniref:integration host factor, actinobacterial type n=1 Tax=Streptomyces globisporus TaxID=1908 RepID=UPI002F90A6E6|nr:integration host factor [Streptomyces globisporus]
MPSPLPSLTGEQRAQALAKAARVRKERGAMLSSLKAGTISLLDVLAREDETTGRTRVLSLLQSLPGIGPVRAKRTLVEFGIAETRRVQGLGARQRQLLIDRFPPQQ